MSKTETNPAAHSAPSTEAPETSAAATEAAPSLERPNLETHESTQVAGVQPWVQVLSRFTSEALFFESLAVSVLAALYLAFWILKKRKYGAANEVVPATLVKTYLSQLIGDAEGIRTQLFGFLESGSAEPRLNLGAALNAVGGGASDPALTARVAEQAKQLETLNEEKTKLEAEVEELKKSASANASAPTIDNSAETAQAQNKIKELQDKIEQLEGRLNEYSVIEDDLANLKRLQQENKKLKEELAGKGGASAAAADAVVAAAPAAATSQDELDSLLGAAPEAAAPAADPVPAPEAPATSDPVAAASSADGFEGLVGSVDSSLPASPAGASVVDPLAALAGDAPADGGTADILAEVAAGEGGDAKPAEKNDADLVAEFEKMLNG